MNEPVPKRRKNLTPEQWILLSSVFCFITFIWLVTFLFLPLLSRQPVAAALNPMIVEIVATQGFILPPTWTPSPTRQIIPSPTATFAYDGVMPTRLYTPQPTSLPGIPVPVILPRYSALDLARIMQGESPGDMEAAYRVGWVAKNRLLHPSYGGTYFVVSHGFFGYRPDLQPSKEFLALARRVMRSKEDPTGGCLYALSRTDITNLGVPPGRADVAYGEWFFFKIWPVTRAGR